MTAPQDAFSYPDCRAFMDKAIESEKGWQITFEERGQATAFRLRCYTARDRERKRNRKIYSEDSPMFDSSVWQKLTFTTKECPEGWQVLAMHGDEALELRGISNGPL